MAPRKKESAEPTRRSARTVSQSCTAAETTTPSATKKRENDELAMPHVSAPEAKKAKTSLAVGDKLPDITLLDEEGNTVQIVDITHEKGVILFAYPRASTPGCTKQVCSCSFFPPQPFLCFRINKGIQACGFRDVFDRVSSKEYLIYGISTDAPKANKNFKEKQGLQYHLLSDQKSELLKSLGATKEGNKTLRSSWVIGKGGIIEDVQLGTSPGDSVSKAMKKLGIE